jgi:hypothetical protein
LVDELSIESRSQGQQLGPFGGTKRWLGGQRDTHVGGADGGTEVAASPVGRRRDR